MKSNTKKSILWIFVLIISINLVLATGIRPAKTTMILEEQSQLESEFWVVNNDQMDFSAKIYVEGEMAEYVTLKTEELVFREDTDALAVEFKVELPKSIPPGQSTANIVVEQVIEPRADGAISSKIVMKHKIIIQGPYPDKYISVKLNFNDLGDNIELVSEVENLGKLALEKVQTKFYVNDKKQEQQVLATETTSLSKDENKLLKTMIDKDLFELGEFDVSAITVFDDQQVELIKKLRVGDPDVAVTYFDQYFIANEVNQYSMDLLNKWNQKIKNVFVDVEISKGQQKVGEFRTKSVDIEGNLLERISDYLDARNNPPGTYDFNMNVNFWDNVRMSQKQQSFTSEFLTPEESEKIENQRPNIAGQATGDLKAANNRLLLIIIIMGIVIILLLSYLIWRYLHRDQYEGGEEAF